MAAKLKNNIDHHNYKYYFHDRESVPLISMVFQEHNAGLGRRGCGGVRGSGIRVTSRWRNGNRTYDVMLQNKRCDNKGHMMNATKRNVDTLRSKQVWQYK